MIVKKNASGYERLLGAHKLCPHDSCPILKWCNFGSLMEAVSSMMYESTCNGSEK